METFGEDGGGIDAGLQINVQGVEDDEGDVIVGADEGGGEVLDGGEVVNLLLEGLEGRRVAAGRPVEQDSVAVVEGLLDAIARERAVVGGECVGKAADAAQCRRVRSQR